MRISISQILVLILIVFLLFGDFSNVKKQFLSFFNKFKK